jgi:hypothetical protein
LIGDFGWQIFFNFLFGQHKRSFVQFWKSKLNEKVSVQIRFDTKGLSLVSFCLCELHNNISSQQ